MPESVESVKAVAAFLRAASEKNSNPDTRTKLDEHAETIEAVVSEVIKLRDLTSALPTDLGNIHELPQELLDELSISKGGCA